MMTYKNYVGVVEFDDEAGVIRGRIANLRDVVTFQGKTVDEVRRAFRDSVDDYLEFCDERGEKPEKPFNGKILVRVKPEIHRSLSDLAAARGVSLNDLIASQLESLATLEPEGIRH